MYLALRLWGVPQGRPQGDVKGKRSPKALIIVTVLIALISLAVAIPRLRPSEILD